MQFQKEFEPILSYFNKNKVFLPGMSQQLILIREANKVLDKQITLLYQHSNTQLDQKFHEGVFSF